LINSWKFRNRIRFWKFIKKKFIFFIILYDDFKLLFIITQIFGRTIRRKVSARLKFFRIYGQTFFKKGVNNDRNIFHSSKRVLRFSHFAVQPANPSQHALPISFFFVPPNESILGSQRKIYPPLRLNSYTHLFLLHGSAVILIFHPLISFSAISHG